MKANIYIQWVAKRLGCLVSDLRLLESIHQEDEEGDNLVSFFPDKLMLQNYDWKMLNLSMTNLISK